MHKFLMSTINLWNVDIVEQAWVGNAELYGMPFVTKILSLHDVL